MFLLFFKTGALPLRRFAQPLPWAMGGAESAGIWAVNNAIAWSCHYFNYAQPLETSLWISSIFNQTIPILALVEERILMCCYLSKIFPIQDIWTICKLWWGQWTIERFVVESTCQGPPANQIAMARPPPLKAKQDHAGFDGNDPKLSVQVYPIWRYLEVFGHPDPPKKSSEARTEHELCELHLKLEFLPP